MRSLTSSALVLWLAACSGEAVETEPRDTEAAETDLDTDALVESDDADPAPDSDPRRDTDPNQGRAPVAQSASWSGQEDAPLDLTLAGSDPDGDAISFSIHQLPVHGLLVGTPPDLRFEPEPDWHGVDRFTFRAHDGVTASALAEVVLIVAPVNDAPIALAQSTVAATLGVEVEVQLAAIDVDGDPLTLVVDEGPAAGTLHGSTWRWTPGVGAANPSELVWHATDPSGLSSASRTVQIAVSSEGAAVAQPDRYQSAGNFRLVVPGADGVLVNDALDPAYACEIALASPTTALGGTVALECDGGFTYTPPLGVGGATDSFSYALLAGGVEVSTGTVSVALHEVVWYVDADATTGTGQSHLPFPTMQQAAAASRDDEIVFVAAGSYTGGVAMRPGQRVLGAAFDLVVGGRTVGWASGVPAVHIGQNQSFELASGVELAHFELTVAGATGVYGAGVDDVQLSSLWIWSTPSPFPSVGLAACDGVVMDNLIVGGGMFAVTLSQCSDVELRDSLVQDVTGRGIDAQACSDLRVLNVDMEEVNDPVYLEGVSGDVRVEDCTLAATSGVGVLVDTPALSGDLSVSVARTDVFAARGGGGDSLLSVGVRVDVGALLGSAIEVRVDEVLVEAPTGEGLTMLLQGPSGPLADPPSAEVRLEGTLVDQPGGAAHAVSALGSISATVSLVGPQVTAPLGANDELLDPSGYGVLLSTGGAATMRATVTEPSITGALTGVKFYARDSSELVARVDGQAGLTELHVQNNGVYALVAETARLDLHLGQLTDTSWGGSWFTAEAASGTSPQLRASLVGCAADAFHFVGPAGRTTPALGLASTTAVGTVYDGSDGGILAARYNSAASGTTVLGRLIALGESEVRWP